ncbi:MAG TPA: lysophospholipid acyltransferase family protein, partial [Luteitalea sp.]|nr:lysophospholipid acyltransferase family protein [Luteitalea sp.]
ERVELLMALEQQFQTILDEAAFAGAATVGDVRALLAGPSSDATRSTNESGLTRSPSALTDVGRPGGPSLPKRGTASDSQTDGPGSGPYLIDFPKWNRAPLPYWVRRASLPTWILPIGRVFARVRTEGLEHLAGLEGPVVFAANHQSHMDTPVILMALPRTWRYATAVAMAKEFFTPHFHPAGYSTRQRVTNGLNYYLASLFFNAFPIPQREAGARQTLRYIGQLFEEGQSLLIFPEGKRTMEGEINEFRAGIGMIGARLGVPVVPVRLVGADRVLHQKAKFPRVGPVTVRFGAPIRLEGDDYAALARQVEAAVRALD